jgi:hypothetical protein
VRRQMWQVQSQVRGLDGVMVGGAGELEGVEKGEKRERVGVGMEMVRREVDVLLVVEGVGEDSSWDRDFTVIVERGAVVLASRIGYSRPLMTGMVSNMVVAIVSRGLVGFSSAGDGVCSWMLLLICFSDIARGF